MFAYRRYLQRRRSSQKSQFSPSWALVAQALNLVITLSLTRVYSPQDFGSCALFTSTAVTLGVVAALRCEYAIVLPDEERAAVQVA